MSLLLMANVLNSNHRFVQKIWMTLDGVLSPLLKPFRKILYKILPSNLPIDLSPLLLILCLGFIQQIVLQIAIS
jgi:uncharacterized protein YggT (Ycf19 family)